MTPSHLACELFLSNQEQATLSFDGREYTDRPELARILDGTLQEAELEPVLYGTRLFEAIFVGDLLTGYREALALARQERLRLRMRFHISKLAPRPLHRLVWERLYDPREALALGWSRELSFSRYITLGRRPQESVRVRPRMLVATASPRDLEAMGRPPIPLDSGLLAPPTTEAFEVETLESPVTAQRLREHLASKAFHVLHLEAHGVLHRRDPKAALILEDEEGQAQAVDEELFAEIFEGQESLRLVTLLACHGGRPSQDDPLSGLGPNLVRRGIPAVVAMGREIDHGSASRFSEYFYRHLGRGRPVDEAINEARFQLHLEAPKARHWSTPTLFLRLPDGHLWYPATETPTLIGLPRKPQTLLLARVDLSEEASSKSWSQILRDLARAMPTQAGESVQALPPGAGAPVGSWCVVFHRPIQAVRYAFELQRVVASQPGLHEARFGIHLAEWPTHEGWSPFEASDEEAATVRALVSMARPGQILLTREAFDLARESSWVEAADGDPPDEPTWCAHGEYRLLGVSKPVPIFEVGPQTQTPLEAPTDSSAAQPLQIQETLPGWRPAPGQGLPHNPRWILEHRLAQGGFGEVWRVRHSKTGERRVFKFCFEASRLRALEREITLFRLLKEELGQRPDIVRILDWNFDHPPFFVESEYAAEGDLVEWAKAQGGLGRIDLGARLEIVAQVAEALDAAHSVGILHKDVKPRNVLIARTDSGWQAQLGDFGIGALTQRERLEAAGITALGLPVTGEDNDSRSGTRLYLAPEILEGRVASTQADVYALGVLLYQMVLGDFGRALAPGWWRDVDDALLREDIEAAVEGSPARRLGNAQTLAVRLRSLERRRQERIERERTENAARDAQAALARGRRRRKFVALAFLVLGFVTLNVWVQGQRVAREADRARQESARAQRANQLLVESFKEADPRRHRGKPPSIEDVLRRGEETLRSELHAEPEVLASLLQTLGRIHYHLGHFEHAEFLLRDAIAQSRTLPEQNPLELAQCLATLAELQADRGEGEEARDLFEEALQLRKDILGTQHPLVAQLFNDLGSLAEERGENEEAQRLYLEALVIRKASLKGGDPAIAQSLNNLAILHFHAGRLEPAEDFFEQALEIRRRTLGDDHPDVGESLGNLANLHWTRGDLARAEELLRESLQILEQVYGPNHYEVAFGLGNLAGLLWNMERLEEATEALERTLEIQKDLLPTGHEELEATRRDLVTLYRELGREDEARPLDD